MKYFFLPFDQHSDLGFGATADSFKNSAKVLLEKPNQDITNQLPLCFLLRHSIELYLKSMIIVVHEGLNIPFENGSSKIAPEILINNKIKSLFSIHSIGDLFEYFSKVVCENSSIRKVAKTDWSDIPQELTEALKRIETFDSKSSYFRYPISKNGKVEVEKSSFKKTKLNRLLSQMRNRKDKPVKAFLLTDETDRVVSSYVYDDFSELNILSDLKYASEILSGAHFGLRTELTNGY